MPDDDLAAERRGSRRPARRRGPPSRRGPSASRRRGRTVPRTSPNDADSGASSGSIECAASPANRARAPSPRNRDAGQARPPSAGPAARSGPGPAGGAARGRPAAAARCDSSPASRLSGPNSRRQARASWASPKAGRRSPPRTARGRRPGPASARGPPARPGWTSSTPCAAQSTVRKNGEATVSGTIVEHTSWRNPGSVSSWVRVPPPIVRRGLVDPDRATGPGQGQGRGQAVGPGADDDRVERGGAVIAARRAAGARRAAPSGWTASIGS